MGNIFVNLTLNEAQTAEAIKERIDTCNYRKKLNSSKTHLSVTTG